MKKLAEFVFLFTARVKNYHFKMENKLLHQQNQVCFSKLF